MKRDKRLRTLRTLQEDRRAWASATFGPNQTLPGLTAHLRKETKELDDAVASGDHAQKHMELADIILLVCGVCDEMKISAEALIECAYTKLAILQQRKQWEAQPDGSFHHVDEGARASSPAAMPELTNTLPPLPYLPGTEYGGALRGHVCNCIGKNCTCEPSAIERSSL